jgi:hypothetical protein
VKIGFHFDADNERLGTFYGAAIEEKFFGALASVGNPGLSTMMYVGDLRLNSFAMEWSGTTEAKVYSFNEKKYADGFAGWLAAALLAWERFPLECMLRCMRRNTYVIYLDSISSQIAESLSRRLEALPHYLGALEINERSPEHRVLYLCSLLPLCRVTGKTVSIFREGFEGEDLDRLLVERCERAGFTEVRYEVFNDIDFID